MKPLVILLATSSSACSFFLESPQDTAANVRLDCAGRTTAPLLDTVAAGIGFGIAISEFTSTAEPGGMLVHSFETGLVGIPALLGGLVYATSAILGFYREGQCTEHNRAIDLRDPLAGAEGHVCRVLTPTVPKQEEPAHWEGEQVPSEEAPEPAPVTRCNLGLRCVDERCVKPLANPCRPVAGAPNVFACDAGQHCVDFACVPLGKP